MDGWMDGIIGHGDHWESVPLHSKFVSILLRLVLTPTRFGVVLSGAKLLVQSGRAIDEILVKDDYRRPLCRN